jgi:ABC-type branched-subunit amino acid transport system substrate-binding protein
VLNRSNSKNKGGEFVKYKIIFAAAIISAATAATAADKKYGVGVTDTEIKLGQTSPYSGPASAYSVIAKAQLAYFKMINDQGGINGRKINLISIDDAYSPAKTVEQTRKLVEQDEVAAILNPLGTPTGLSVRKYLNDKKVPQLFVGAGATLWGDHEHFPFTIGFQASYQAETAVYAKYVLKNKPDAKIALFYQNDDAGKDYGNGFKKGLGPDNVKKMVISEATYEPTDPTIDSQIVKLKSSGADVLFMHAIPKQAAQAIRKIGEIGWKPDMFFLAATSTSVSSVLKPAGFEYSKGIISSYSLKDPNDPQWQNDKDVQDWAAFMKKYFPDGNIQDQLIVYGYVVAEATVQVIKQCGDDLTHENIMKQAANLDIVLPMLLPGVRLKTSPTDYFPIEAMRLQRFNGETWELFGDVIGND